MDWIDTFVDRLIATPSIHWLDEDRLNLLVDNNKPTYALSQKVMIAIIGRAIKRGRDIGVFCPCTDEADLATLLTYLYALWFDVHFNLAAPGHWINRRTAKSNRDIMVVGNGPMLRKLLVNRCTFGKQPIKDYMGIHWLSHHRNTSKVSPRPFAGEGLDHDMGIYIVPKSKVTEQNLAYYHQECSPFAIIFDLSDNAYGDRNLISYYRACKKLFPSVPVVYLAPAGDMATMKLLRDTKQIDLWVTRANDISLLEHALKEKHPRDKSVTAMEFHSNQLADGITIQVQIIQDDFFNTQLGELAALVNRLEKESSLDDKAICSAARTILRELAVLAVPLGIQEELHRLERRSGPYATRLLRNRIDELARKRGSVGVVTDLVNTLSRKLNELANMLAKSSAITGKCHAVLQWTQQQLTKGKQPLLTCPNESIRMALITHLSKKGVDTMEGSVDVLTRSTLWKEVRKQRIMERPLLWLGVPDFHSGAFFGGVIPDITVMCYPSEKQGLEKQFGYIEHNTQKRSLSDGDKLSLIRNLPGPHMDRQVDPDSQSPWSLIWSEWMISGIYPEGLPPVESFTLPEADWMQEWLDEPPPPPAPMTCNVAEPCVVITLSDGEADITLPLMGTVMVLEEICGQSEGIVPVEHLQTGMTVLVPRDDPRRPLVDRLIDNLRNDTDYFISETLAERWYFAVETIATRTNGDTEQALRLLKRYGVDITTPSGIYAWFRHLVIGPRTLQSLRAVVEASEMPEIINKINHIWKAIKYVRRVRRKLMADIAKYIRSGMGTQRDRCISKELNLYGSDLEEYTRIGEIMHITRR